MREFRIGGVATNIPFMAAVPAHPDFVANRISTDFIDTQVAALVGASTEIARPLFFACSGAAAATTRNSGEPVSGPVRSLAVPAPLQGTNVAIELPKATWSVLASRSRCWNR